MTYLETEIKLYVPDLAAVEARLRDAGAVLHSPRVFENNMRYENADQTLTARGVVLRLREDAKIRLTYKEPVAQVDADIPSRFEVEVEVSDLAAMALILSRLGYHPHVTYEKYRTTYLLDATEVVLDELPYGNFVEIEGQPEAIRHVIQQIGLGEARQYRSNYIHLFENIRHALNLNIQHLTFENFKHISVPEAAFAEPPARDT